MSLSLLLKPEGVVAAKIKAPVPEPVASAKA
jgi:hypothetical protein